MGEETLFSQDPDDCIERENVGFSELTKDSESEVRRVMADEASGDQVVLVSAELKDTSVDLKETRV